MKKQFLKRAGALFLAAALVAGAVQIPAFQTKAAAWVWNSEKSVTGYKKVPYSELTAVADSEERTRESSGAQGRAELAVDGNTGTYWHSKYSDDEDGSTKLSAENGRLSTNNTMTITLANPQDIAGITYLPRQDGAGNGIWVDVKVEVLAEGSDTYESAYVVGEDGSEKLTWNRSDWNAENKQERELIFSKTFENIEKVKITVNETDGENSTKAFINAAEISVLKPILFNDLVEINRSVLSEYAKANSEQNPVAGTGDTDGPARYAFNGQDGNWWHSRWQGNAAEGEVGGTVSADNPIWIQTGFGEKRIISALQYQGRSNGNNIIGQYDISIANLEDPTEKEPAEDEWKVVQSGTFTATAEMQTVMLNKAVQATHIRLTAKSRIGGGDDHLTAMHIKVYALPTGEAEGITVVSAPEKTRYMLGEDFNLSGLAVRPVYPGGEVGVADISLDDVTISGYDKTTLGEQTLTVYYGNLKTTFTVEVVVRQEKIDTTKLLDYAKANSEQADASGNGLGNDGPASWAFDGNTSHWWHSRYQQDGQTVNTGRVSSENPIWIQIGFGETRKIVALAYQGRTDQAQATNSIGDYQILAANLDTPEEKDPSDESFDVVAAEGKFAHVKELQFANFVNPVPATHIRLVATSATTGINTHVTAADIQLFALIEDIVCIRVTPPTKTEYVVGETLNTEGMKVEAIHGDGTAEEIDLNQVEINGFDNTKRGKQTLTVIYSPEGEESFTADFDVKVTKASDVENGLVGYYTFDDETVNGSFANMADITTDEGKLADATIKGAESVITQNEDAIYGKSVSFGNTASSGANKAYLQIESAFESTADTTISFWMKPDAYLDSDEAAATAPSIFHERKNDNEGRSIVFYRGNKATPKNKLGSYINASNLYDDNDGSSDGIMTTGKWYHVVAVNGGTSGTFQFYVNGAAGYKHTGVSNYVQPGDTKSALMIGAHRANDIDIYNGLLDNVRIYDRALSAAEVAAIYDVEQPRDEAEAVVISPEQVEITTLDNAQTLTVDVEPGDAAEPVSYIWKSDNESVTVEQNDDNTATVKATAEGAYSANITVTATTASENKLTAECKVFVDIPSSSKTTIVAEPDKDSTEMGTVTITADGQEIKSGDGVDVGAEVVITAEAEEGYRFVSWKDADGKLVTRDASITLTVGEEDIAYYAHFKKAVSNVKNVAAGKTTTGRNGLTAANTTSFVAVTDGKTDAYADFTVYVDGEATYNSGAVQIDLGKKYENIDYMSMIRYHEDGRSYKGTAIVVSDDTEMKDNPTIIYNSDKENNHNLGAGTEALYPEATDGSPHIFVAPENTSGRYVTIFMQGNSKNEGNHIVEFEVYAPEGEVEPGPGPDIPDIPKEEGVVVYYGDAEDGTLTTGTKELTDEDKAIYGGIGDFCIDVVYKYTESVPNQDIALLTLTDGAGKYVTIWHNPSYNNGMKFSYSGYDGTTVTPENLFWTRGSSAPVGQWQKLTMSLSASGSFNIVQDGTVVAVAELGSNTSWWNPMNAFLQHNWTVSQVLAGEPLENGQSTITLSKIADNGGVLKYIKVRNSADYETEHNKVDAKVAAEYAAAEKLTAGLKEDDYTKDSWSAYQAALEGTSGKTTDWEMLNAIDAIKAAIALLKDKSAGITDALKAKLEKAELLNEQIKDDETYSEEIRTALAGAIKQAQDLLAKGEVTEEEVAAVMGSLEKAYEDAYLGQGTGTYNPNVQTQYWDNQKEDGALSEQAEDDIWHYQVHSSGGEWQDISADEFTESGDNGNGFWGSDGNAESATFAWGAIWRTKLTPCFQSAPYDAIAFGWKASRGGYVKISLADTISLHSSSSDKDDLTMSYRKGSATADTKSLFSKTFTVGSQSVDTADCVAYTKVEAGDYLRIVAELANNDLNNVQPVITYVTAKEYAPEYLKEINAMTLEDGAYTEDSVAAFNNAKKALSDAVAAGTGTNAEFEDLVEAMEAAVNGLKPNESPKTLESITVTPPTKTTYKVGDTLDTAGMKVTANYSDGSTEDVTSAATLSGFDSASAGTKTVTVTYEGKTATFTVTVEEEGTTPGEKTLESIEVTPPTKTTYKVGEELDKTGLKVTAKYSDGSTEDVTEQAVLSGFDSTAEGEQTITVTYEGKTAEFTVTVEKEGSEKPPVEKPLLRSITVTPPAKTVYKAGEALDLTGMKVTAAYSDGTTADVTADAIVSGYDPNKAGTQTITVSYNGKTVTFTVTVEDGQTPVVTPPETQTPQGDGNGNSPAVATGDNTPIGLMMTLMLLAAGVIVMTRKKRAI